MKKLEVALVGAGAFGSNHLRVLNALENVQVTAVADSDAERAQKAADTCGAETFTDYRDLARMNLDAAIVAVPTVYHHEVGCWLLDRGVDVLLEKPIAVDLVEAASLANTAEWNSRILQIGHLERFNPAVRAVSGKTTLPLFFEIHRMSVFSPRSLDVDVVLDLMIHDIDIVLSMVGKMPVEIRAAGISVLSEKVDIANVRLAFEGGCIANLTASRVSIEKVRKLRLFQPRQYISLDYQRQDAVSVNVGKDQQIEFDALGIEKAEPLRSEIESFLDCVRSRSKPLVDARSATAALEVCLKILQEIEVHSEVVAGSLQTHLTAVRD